MADPFTGMCCIAIVVIAIVIVVFYLLFFSALRGRKTIHVVQNGKKEPDRRCPKCGRIIPFDSKICPYCKNEFE